jgi:hypothetical protein
MNIIKNTLNSSVLKFEDDKFIVFGCWNNTNIKNKDGINKPIGCIRDVMTMLNEYLEINKPNFMVIAGDNYYPDKNKKTDGKKIKIIYSNKLIEGFDLLPKKLPIHMILGNHDLETNGKKESLYINDLTTVENKDCFILKTEKQSILSKLNIDYKLFDSKRLKNNTLLLMIDTSMYSDDVNIFLPCYNIFLGTNFQTSQELIDFQNNKIYDAITSFGKIDNIIMIGHHPITGLKFKNELNRIELLNDIQHFNEVLKKIYELSGQNETKYYYLCADLHMYQEGNIGLFIDDNNTMNIKQYISGIGGTKLDDKIPDNISIPTREGITYEMIQNITQCGFLECNIGVDMLNVRPILLNKLLGGRKSRKTRKTIKTRKTRKMKKTRKIKKR